MRKRALYEIEEDTPSEFTAYSTPRSGINSKGEEFEISLVSEYFRSYYPDLNQRTIDMVYQRNDCQFHETIAE